jgi:sulfite oxidase
MFLSATKPDLIVRSEDPFNAETPLPRLRSSFTTAQADFYVRSHGPVPRLEERTHRLSVGGRVSNPLDLSMADLRERFPRRSVMAVLQCAGNRRGDLQQVRPVSGDPWNAGAIGNALWTGIALTDVLRAAGIPDDPGLHVVLTASEDCEVDDERFRYEVSIPIGKALSPEVLLATGMNGEPLAPAHGYPLRAMVPGFAGVRSAKWLSRITVQDHPSEAKPQARDYKLFPPDVTQETADWEKGVPIYDMPLNAAICEPAAYASLEPGPTVIRGYAVATARAIARVDVSLDGGRSWHQARLEHDPAAPWSWTVWELTVDLPRGARELAVRAWDSAGQTQPALPDDTWNFKGYLNAAWHRVPVRVG